MSIYKSKVYILTDKKNRIINIDGGYSIANVDTNTWTLIDEGEGDKYSLCQSNYLDKPLLTDDGIYQYKYFDGHVEERTEEEMQEDREALPPAEATWEERMEAQVLWTAIATDSYLGEV